MGVGGLWEFISDEDGGRDVPHEGCVDREMRESGEPEAIKFHQS